MLRIYHISFNSLHTHRTPITHVNLPINIYPFIYIDTSLTILLNAFVNRINCALIVAARSNIYWNQHEQIHIRIKLGVRSSQGVDLNKRNENTISTKRSPRIRIWLSIRIHPESAGMLLINRTDRHVSAIRSTKSLVELRPRRS